MNLTELTKAFSGVSTLGKKEVTFPINGTEITLRVISGPDQVHVDDAMGHLIDDDDFSESAQIQSFFQNTWRETLARSIVQIGNLNLRNLDEIATGEFLDNGVPVVVSKVDAVKKILAEWSPDLLASLNDRYDAMRADSEAEIQLAFNAEPVSYDAEIQRLKDRISELEQRKIQQSDRIRMARETLLKSKLEQKIAARQQGVEEVVDPEDLANPEMPKAQEAPLSAPPERTNRVYTQPLPQEAPPPDEMGPRDIYGDDDSFVDPSDQEAIDRANFVAFERRQEALRRQAAQGAASPGEGSPRHPRFGRG